MRSGRGCIPIPAQRAIQRPSLLIIRHSTSFGQNRPPLRWLEPLRCRQQRQSGSGRLRRNEKGELPEPPPETPEAPNHHECPYLSQPLVLAAGLSLAASASLFAASPVISQPPYLCRPSSTSNGDMKVQRHRQRRRRLRHGARVASARNSTRCLGVHRHQNICPCHAGLREP